MKQTLLQVHNRVRLMLAMLAMFGAMWAAVDFHQHEDGLHQQGQCIACSLEKSVAHGFTLHTAIQAISCDEIPNLLIGKIAYVTPACHRSVSIRAPPFA